MKEHTPPDARTLAYLHAHTHTRALTKKRARSRKSAYARGTIMYKAISYFSAHFDPTSIFYVANFILNFILRAHTHIYTIVATCFPNTLVDGSHFAQMSILPILLVIAEDCHDNNESR